MRNKAFLEWITRFEKQSGLVVSQILPETVDVSFRDQLEKRFLRLTAEKKDVDSLMAKYVRELSSQVTPKKASGETPDMSIGKHINAELTNKAPAVNTHDPVKMDRRSLRSALSDAKAAGASVSWSKTDNDDLLRVKLAEALSQLQTPAVSAKLDAILESATDCFGLFIDFRQPSCLGCPSKEECYKLLLKNMENDFGLYIEAGKHADAHEQAAKVKPKDLPSQEALNATVKKKKRKAAEIVYNKTQRFSILVDKNPEKKGDENYKFFRAFLKERPETFSDLRKLLGKHFEVPETLDGQKELTIEYVKAMVEEGIIAVEE